jgi:hypothetical protein
MSDDLAAFLKGRLDEIEAAAKLAAREGGTWTQDDPVRYPGSISSLGGPVVYDEGSPDEYQAAHIARHDPADTLRDVAADRLILAVYVLQDEDPGYLKGLEYAIACRAERFSGHPDYRQEWTP